MAYARFENMPGSVHHAVIETNLMGQIYGSRAVLPYFRQQGSGVLINVASLYAKMTSPYVSPYVISKFGVLGLSEVLRQELLETTGISVSTVLPASVDTPIFRHAGNYTGRQVRPVPPVSDPQRVVRAILRGADGSRDKAYIGQIGRMLSWSHAAVPGLYDRLVPHAMSLLGLGDHTVEPGPGNVLFEPMPEWNRVTGDRRERRNRRLRRSAVVAGVASGLVAVVRLRR